MVHTPSPSMARALVSVQLTGEAMLLALRVVHNKSLELTP